MCPVTNVAWGIKNLSQLLIDVDKDWGGYGITSVKELAAGMVAGDLLASDGTRLVRVPCNNIGDELTTHGPGYQVDFHAPPGG